VSALTDIEGLLLDIDGVLVVAWEALPGAADTLGWLRKQEIAFRLATNTTSLTRRDLANKLRDAGLDVTAEELVTAPAATGSYLRTHYPGARCYLVGEGGAAEDLGGVDLVEENADVVVVAGADRSFTWENLNRAFRMLLDGAKLVVMHRNLSWRTEGGMTLDSGAFILGLEKAADVHAEVVGKPAPDFFKQCLELLGVPGDRTAIVGDDVEADVLAGQALGLTGVLVRTGKFREETLGRASGRPAHVIDSIADLPGLLR
jgi:HAD superfamily hydrolase (TIGR01458 family)